MRKPGRGWAALIETTGGTFIAISSRGCSVSVDGSLRFFRPAAVSGLVIDQALAEPLSGVPTYDDVQLEIENTGWWVADHTTTDRLDGATVTIWRETEGSFDPDADVQWKGFVLRRGGVSATNRSVRLTCRDVFGFYAEGATIGGVRTLNQTDFPALAPPTPIEITMAPLGSSGSDEIKRIRVTVFSGVTLTFTGSDEIPSPFPISGPVPGVPAGSGLTFVAAGLDDGGTPIWRGTATGCTVTSGIPPRVWIALSTDDTSASPEDISNPWEDQPIPVAFGQYLGGAFAVPCMVYDWGVTTPDRIKYVVEDQADLNGDPQKTQTDSNHETWLIDTAPPTTDKDGEPIEHPIEYVDLYTSVTKGQYAIISEIPNLLVWHGQGTSGFPFASFELDVSVWAAWTQALTGEAIEFDPARFILLTKHKGPRCNDASMPVGANSTKPLANAVRILVEYIGIPSAYIDWDAITPIDDSLDAKPRRWITSAEDAGDLYASLLEECQILHYIRADGLISWRINQVNAPPPAVVSFTERNTIRDSIEWTANDWGPRFNAVNGQRDQGLPYQPDQRLSPRPEILISDPLPDGVEKIPYAYTFRWLWDAENQDAFLRALLRVQGAPGDTVKLVAHLDEADVATGYTIHAGDTIKYAYIASRIDATMKRLIEADALFRVLRVGHDMDHAEHALTVWRIGSDPTYQQGSMLMMGGDELFSDGSAMGLVWDAGWPDWKKREAANWGSGKGGWMSETSAQILIADTSPYAVSPMG